jgi:membrane associated rhomboid family serine protease
MLLPLFDLNPHRRVPIITLLIIAINAGVTAWTWSLPQMQQQVLAVEHGFLPARLTAMGKGQPIEVRMEVVEARGWGWFAAQGVKLVRLSTAPANVYLTFLTTLFLHGGWGHVLMNMWMLWVFGNNIEDRLGHFVFAAFYLVGGVLATLVFWVTNPNGTIPVIGASGAVAAVLGAYAVTFPTAKVRTLVFFVLITIIDLPALAVLGIWFVMQLASGLMGLWGWGAALEPVAFWAHVGGFVAGMVLMPLLSLGASPTGKDWRKEIEEMFRFDDPRGGV